MHGKLANNGVYQLPQTCLLLVLKQTIDKTKEEVDDGNSRNQSELM
jgi:hypothetical protein